MLPVLLLTLIISIDEVIPILYWLTVEAPISIVSICLPSIFSLVKRGVHYGPYSLISSRDVSEIYAGKMPKWPGTKTRTVVNRSRGDTLGTVEFDNSFERLNDERSAEFIAMASKTLSNTASTDNSEFRS